MSEHYDWAFSSYNFIKIFIIGLKGDWQGINFSGRDNPIYIDE